LTVIIGAKCSDGIVMIADRKITDRTGNTLQYDNKILGDMEQILQRLDHARYYFH
jgi:20S proteasome alpha/beta subunit